MTGLLRTGGALALLVVAVGIVSAVVTGRGARLVELQLGTDAATVQALVDDAARRRAVRRAIAVDYAFIAAYLGAFVVLGVAIVRREGGWTAVGAAAVAAAIATAALDVLENVRTVRMLDARPLTQERLDALRRASLAKWGACALTVGLLAGVFVAHGWPLAVAVALLAIAALGLCSLRWRSLVPAFFLCVFLATIAIATLLLAAGPSVARRY